MGEVVPIPTFPACVTTKSVLVDEPTTNAGTFAARPVVSTEMRAQGVVVPNPTVLPKIVAPLALNVPEMVEEPVTERSEVVAEIVLIPANWLVDDAEIP